MTKGFGGSRKYKKDSRDFFLEKQNINKIAIRNQFKPAIITPYYKENIKLIKRCYESCKSQTYKASHFLVSDGFPNPEINNWDVNHIILSEAHNDYGNTPRGIGALSAINQGFNVILFLDADNWFENKHLESVLEMKIANLSFDIISTYRNLVLPSGEIVKSDKVDLEKKHIDTNCMIFFESSFFLLPFWTTMTKELSVIGDRIMFKRFKDNNLKIGFTEQKTVNYRTNFKVHYLKNEINPPKDSKELNLSNLKKFSENKFFNWNRFDFDLRDYIQNLKN